MSTEPRFGCSAARSQSDITWIALSGNDAKVEGPRVLTECSTERYLRHESWTVHNLWYEQDIPNTCIPTYDGHCCCHDDETEAS